MSPLLEAILSGVGTVGELLDAPGGYVRGALAGDLGERRSGREMLESWGVLGENEEGLDAGDVLGFGADMLLDPLNLLSGGTLGAMKAANKGIDAANAVSKANAASNARSLSMRMAGAMPEEVVPLSQANIGQYAVKPGMEGDLVRAMTDPDRLSAAKAGWAAEQVQSAKSPLREALSMANDPSNARWSPGIEEVWAPYLDRVPGPTPYFHGTPRQGVEATNFNLDRAGSTTDSGWYGRGGYFADSPVDSDDYTHNRAGDVTGSIIKAFLDVRNPYRPQAHEARGMLKQMLGEYGTDRFHGIPINSDDALDEYAGVSSIGDLLRMGENPEDLVPWLTDPDLVRPEDLSAAITDTLKARGHDGVFVPPGKGGASDIPEYVVFDSRQIHSPYVAPALRNVDPLRDRHDISPVLAAMIGNTALQAPYDTRRNP